MNLIGNYGNILQYYKKHNTIHGNGNDHDYEGSKDIQRIDVMEKMKLEHELMKQVR